MTIDTLLNQLQKYYKGKNKIMTVFIIIQIIFDMAVLVTIAGPIWVIFIAEMLDDIKIAKETK